MLCIFTYCTAQFIAYLLQLAHLNLEYVVNTVLHVAFHHKHGLILSFFTEVNIPSPSL